ncbi:hypothetical protein SAMN05216548_101550 [Faunimonas pinastri]|uniref:Uncharacterized protein n=1 Tax=Faunimonas pinastri TaxID=1855383 RepID=A0A1H9AWT3_9HYPH|nr:hypothetical protein [Faunimonas pinastri]SEP81262.1 hypothetical protein SAMN05216548_101550 [Faunimonas pinastri]
MSSKMPAVPPASRNSKAPGGRATPKPSADTSVDKKANDNLDEQGRQGNIHQNTTHQGHQQDR